MRFCNNYGALHIFNEITISSFKLSRAKPAYNLDYKASARDTVYFTCNDTSPFSTNTIWCSTENYPGLHQTFCHHLFINISMALILDTHTINKIKHTRTFEVEHFFYYFSIE